MNYTLSYCEQQQSLHLSLQCDAQHPAGHVHIIVLPCDTLLLSLFLGYCFNEIVSNDVVPCL